MSTTAESQDVATVTYTVSILQSKITNNLGHKVTVQNGVPFDIAPNSTTASKSLKIKALQIAGVTYKPVKNESMPAGKDVFIENLQPGISVDMRSAAAKTVTLKKS